MSYRKSIGVITAIFGNYDEVPPVPNGFDKAILVTDSPIYSDWQNIILKVPINPILSAKLPKFRPDIFISTDSSVWIDANFRDPENLLSNASRHLLEESDLALCRHPTRNSIFDEIKASEIKFKYKGIDFLDQFRQYEKDGFTDNKGLWAGGIIARNHTRHNELLGNEWLLQNIIWNTQDQISLPYILHKFKVTPTIYPDDLYKGKIYFVGHGTNWVTRKRDILHILYLIRIGEFATIRKFVKDIFRHKMKQIF